MQEPHYSIKKKVRIMASSCLSFLVVLQCGWEIMMYDNNDYYSNVQSWLYNTCVFMCLTRLVLIKCYLGFSFLSRYLLKHLRKHFLNLKICDCILQRRITIITTCILLIINSNELRFNYHFRLSKQEM